MIDIVSKINAVYEQRRRVYPCRSNRASEIGHPCSRYLVYSRLRWQDKKIPSSDLMQLFDLGNALEDFTIKKLTLAGIEVTNQQRDFEDKKHEITGHTDGFISADGKDIPIEIKGINPHDWAKIDSVEDMTLAPKSWLRKYPAQLQTYLYLSNNDVGCMILLNKTNAQIKPIWMELDYDYMEKLLKKCSIVNDHVRKETYPDRIEYDEAICPDCPFAHICLPEVINKSIVELADMPDVVEKLTKRFELQESAKQFDALDNELKERAKGFENDVTVVGEYMFTRKTRVVKQEAREAKETEQTIIKIQRLGDVKKD